jgi:hypothetical protein
MENLHIKQGPSKKIRKGLGVFTFLIAIVWIIIFVDSHKFFDILQSLLWALLGTYHFTEGFSLERAYILIVEAGLEVKLTNRIRPVFVADNEIENICLKRSEVIINRKEKKPLKIKRNYIELKQMTEIYKFFIEYTSMRNLVLVRDF